MARPTVFYAWQSDLPKRTTRSLIHDATQAAIVRLENTLSLIDSPRIDYDTLDESGAPAITETIFRKIKEAAVFIADVSSVGATASQNGQSEKLLPNPNVMLELGYAAATIGWDRVILVMNKHYGSPECLPFDLRNRRFPITYELGPESPKSEQVSTAASTEIEFAVRSALAAEYQRVEAILPKLSSYTRGILKKHAGELFWEMADDNSFLSRLDLAISQLLEYGLIQCVEAASEKGLAYSWTYFGQQCYIRLGYQIPQPYASLGDQFVMRNVTVDLSNYDSLLSPQ